MKMICILSLFLISSPLLFGADAWDDKVMNLMPKYKAPFTDNFASTLSGYCHVSTATKHKMEGIVSEFDIPLEGFETKKMSVRFLLHTVNNVPVKSPLMIFIPGAFMPNTSDQADQMLKDFSARGYHVLVLNNPWSPKYIKQKPFHYPGSFMPEAQSIFAQVQTFYHDYFIPQYDDFFNGSVNVTGISYGAFMSASLAALDAESSTPIINGKTTLISPPYHLPVTLARLDSFLIRYTRNNLNDINYFLNYKNYCRHEKDGKIAGSDLLRARQVISYFGFKYLLAEALGTYDDVWKRRRILQKKWYSIKYFLWLKHLTFNGHLTKFAPEVLEMMTRPEAQIYNWIARAQNAGKTVRVFAANDDFLNDPNVWSEVPDALIVEDGGHYGFRSLPWMQEFFDAAF